MTIIHIVGNRPQFVKLAVLYPALAAKGFTNRILHSGQHYDENMSDRFFTDLSIPAPDANLEVNRLSRAPMIEAMVSGMEGLFSEFEPDAVVVYGDTNTTLAGALAARKKNLLLAHVEAGVRTGDDTMPEEINRRRTDELSDINFCCTRQGMEQLRQELAAFPEKAKQVYNTGDLMLDALRAFDHLEPETPPVVDHFNPDSPFTLATIHRAENTGHRQLAAIVEAFNQLHREQPLIWPMHPKIKQLLQAMHCPVRFHVCEALDYPAMQYLIKKSSWVITDSGGMAREAFFRKKPTLVMMKHPFWPELFEYGNCLPCRADAADMLQQAKQLIRDPKPFKVDIFGDGHAAEKMAGILATALRI